MEESGAINQYSKKAIASLRREHRKITRNLSGIREMSGIPGAMVVVDPGREYNAVREANKMGLAVIGMLDTDCDPDGVDIVIPGNDDALRSVRLLIESLVQSVEEGASAHRDRMASVGSAERSSEEVSGDEPRPTRGRQVTRPRSQGSEEGGGESVELPNVEPGLGESEEGVKDKAPASPVATADVPSEPPGA